MEKNLYIDASHPNETRVVLKSDGNIEDYEYEGIKNSLIKNRKKHIGPNLSLHYNQPLHLVKSKKQYLYDDNGNKFLDAIGNINIVGHCNKNVVNAIKKQSLLLNTNTRYLYKQANREK